MKHTTSSRRKRAVDSVSPSMDRRQFVKTAAAAGAVSLGFGVWSELPAAESKSPNEKLNIAGIGTGGMASADLGDPNGFYVLNGSVVSDPVRPRASLGFCDDEAGAQRPVMVRPRVDTRLRPRTSEEFGITGRNRARQSSRTVVERGLLPGAVIASDCRKSYARVASSCMRRRIRCCR